MPEQADRFVLNIPLEAVAQSFGRGGGFYPSDDDYDIVNGPGGPRALRDLLRYLEHRQVARGAGGGSNPNPDEDDDFGPGWPFVRDMLEAVRRRRLTLAQAARLLARLAPHPDPWITAEPEPLPWRATLLARVSIDRLIGLAQAAEFGGEQSQQAVSRQVAQLVDDYCGTPPRRPRWPLPWPFRLTRPDEKFVISPSELVTMGAQFYQASEALGDAPLASDFAAAAHRLAQTGFDRLAAPARTAETPRPSATAS